MGDSAVKARRCEGVQEVFSDETSDETRGPAETASSRERITGSFGTGGVAQKGFGTVLVQFAPETGLEAGFEMDVLLENALESMGTSSRGVAQPGSAPALG